MDEILTIEDLAAILGKQPKTLYNWKNRGISLPQQYQVPGMAGVRFLRTDVIAWIKQFAVPTEKPNAKRGRPRKAQAVQS